MSTNPNKAIGTNAAYGGRTSVKAFNDALGIYDGRGIVSGWGVSPKLGMVVKVGGNGTARDIAIAENNTGDYTTINNISEEPVSITIPTAPTSNARYDSIVAYVDNPPSGSATVADNPAAVGIIVVSGTVAGSPTFADESTIRDAITVDGGTGATAYYVVLADIYVASETTDITANLITVRNYATTSKITPSSVTSSMLAQEGLGVPMYASNLAIANDTPRVWAETLGETGHYWIWYEESGLFANQPTQYGVLEVFVWMDGTGRYDVSQTWYNHPNGTRMYHRTGNTTGWNGLSSGSGAFTQLAMLPVTSDNIDWTTFRAGGTGTLNSTYFSGGNVKWQTFGKVVIVYVYDAKLSTAPPANAWATAAITNVPKIAGTISESSYVDVPALLAPFATNGRPLRVRGSNGSQTFYFHYSSDTATGVEYTGQIIYLTE